jgi:hypothetical protein
LDALEGGKEEGILAMRHIGGMLGLLMLDAQAGETPFKGNAAQYFSKILFFTFDDENILPEVPQLNFLFTKLTNHNFFAKINTEIIATFRWRSLYKIERWLCKFYCLD